MPIMNSFVSLILAGIIMTSLGQQIIQDILSDLFGGRPDSSTGKRLSLNPDGLTAEQYTSKAFNIGDKDGDERLSTIEILKFFRTYIGDGKGLFPLTKKAFKYGDADDDDFLVPKEFKDFAEKFLT